MNFSRLVEVVRQDRVYALRAMRKAPGLAVTLGLAIGANTAIFTVVRAVTQHCRAINH
jgi:hypothetical protein